MTDNLLRPPRDLSLLVRWCIFAAVAVSVGVFDLGSQKPFDVVKFSTVWFFVALAAGLWVAQLIRGREGVGRSTMGLLALGFFASSAISALFSRTKMTAIFGWYGRYTGLVTIAIFVAAFFVISSVYRGRAGRVRELIWALSAGAIVLVGYILMQWAGIDPIKWATTAGTIPGLKYFGTMGNADFAGGFLGLTAPCVFYAFLASDRAWKRALVGVWGAAQLWCLWLTSARNGIAAFGLGVLALLFLYRKSLPRFVRWAVALGTAAVVALAVVIVVTAAGGEQRGAEQSVLRSNTVKVRAYWWLAGIKVFVHHPVFGTGPDTFVSEYQRYLSPQAANVADSEIADKPHNVFIDHLATQGLVGTGLYLALIVLAFVRGYRRMRDGPPEERLVLGTLLALLAAYVGQAFFSIDVIPIGFGGWVILGGIAALADPPDVGAVRRKNSSGRTLAAVAVIVLFAIVAALGTAPLKADHEAHTAARIASDQGGVEDVTMHYDRARFYDPFEPIHPGAEGDYIQKQADGESDRTNRREMLQRSVALYRKMLSLQPDYHLWMMTLAKGIGDLATTGGASLKTSEDWFAKARKQAPNDWRVPDAHGDVLFGWARATHSIRYACRAQAEYRHAAQLRHNQPAPLIGVGKTWLALGQLSKAVKPFRRAARLDKRSSEARSLLRSTLDLIKHPPKDLKVVSCG